MEVQTEISMSRVKEVVQSARDVFARFEAGFPINQSEVNYVNREKINKDCPHCDGSGLVSKDMEQEYYQMARLAEEWNDHECESDD